MTSHVVMQEEKPKILDAVAASVHRYWLSAGTQTVLDISVLMAAFIFSYLLRFDFHIPRKDWHFVVVQTPFVVLLQLIVLTLAGGRGFIWRYTDIAHIKAFLYAALVSLLPLVLLRVILSEAHQSWRVPLSVGLIDSVLAFGGTFGLRLLRRATYESKKKRGLVKVSGTAGKKFPVLLIGAGQAGFLAAKEIEGRGGLDLEIKGFVDDDRMKLGRSVIQRHKVLGTSQDIPRLVRSMGIDHVVITIAQASRKDINRIVKICEETPVKVKIIPGLYEIIDGQVGISRIRDVKIEDLLGRDPVQLDLESIRLELSGKTVLVTGAGGSIGSELARQVMRFSAAKLLLIERAEFALFNIVRTLEDQADSLVPLVADIGDESRMRFIFETYRPQVVIHAAAHKHVPLMEANACEAIKNNVLNTRLLGELACEFKAESFVLISTDKAVRPTSIMGASKRVAELVVQDLGRRFDTRVLAVRFGNVIGSNGSAVPIFQEQIRQGGPLTITDKRMTRYFMTIPEAAQLVLQASTIGRGGEVFVLHMGDPVRIMDLAETLISLSGLKPHDDIKIVETGIRPGEKLYEELRFEHETTLPTSHPKIFVSKIKPVESSEIQFAVQYLTELVNGRDDTRLRLFLNKLIPEARLTGALSADQVDDDKALAAGQQVS